MSATAERARAAPAKRPAAKSSAAKKSTAKKSTARKRPQDHANGAVSTRSAPRKARKQGAVSRARSSAALFVIDVAALRSRTRRRRLAIGSLILLVGSFFGVALVQAQLVQTQSDLDLLQSEIATLENDIALLDRSVVVASSPEEIVRRAQDLGMVRAVRPVYLVAVRPLGQ